MKERMKYDAFVDLDAGDIVRKFYFLSRAVSNGKDWRPMFKYIFIEDGENNSYVAIATDGKRMHIVRDISHDLGVIFGFKPGYWIVISAKPSRVQIAKVENPDCKFPEWKKIIPENPAKFTTSFSGFSLSQKRVGVSSGHFAKLMRAFPEPAPININYLSDLGYGDEWQVKWYGSTASVVFESASQQAIIMPLYGD